MPFKEWCVDMITRFQMPNSSHYFSGVYILPKSWKTSPHPFEKLPFIYKEKLPRRREFPKIVKKSPPQLNLIYNWLFCLQDKKKTKGLSAFQLLAMEDDDGDDGDQKSDKDSEVSGVCSNYT